MNKFEKFSCVFIIAMVISGMVLITIIIDKIWLAYLPEERWLEGIVIVAFTIFCLFCGGACEKGIAKYHKSSR